MISTNQIMQCVRKQTEEAAFSITWDVRELALLDTTTLGKLYRYLIEKRDLDTFNLKINGRADIQWQQKSTVQH